MAGFRYRGRVVRLTDGSFRGDFDAFGGFHVHGASIAEVQALAPGQLAAHIDDLQRAHEPVIQAEGIDWELPPGPA